MVMSEPQAIERLRNLAADLPAGLRAQFSHPNFLEVTRSDADKGNGLARYCSRRDIRLRDVIAIGDGLNDLSMFTAAGTSIAPANPRAEVLAAARWWTRSNDDDGVAQALRMLVS